MRLRIGTPHQGTWKRCWRSLMQPSEWKQRAVLWKMRSGLTYLLQGLTKHLSSWATHQRKDGGTEFHVSQALMSQTHFQRKNVAAVPVQTVSSSQPAQDLALSEVESKHYAEWKGLGISTQGKRTLVVASGAMSCPQRSPSQVPQQCQKLQKRNYAHPHQV